MTHTPAPWTVDEDIWIIEGNEHYPGQIAAISPRGGLKTEERAANARLIAAAPELYSLVRAWLLSDPHGTHSDACRDTIAQIEGK